ncbi:MAG: tRNA epoxyqueuosine(34) reductase QueG, partial [Bradyrhizobiaceae bacterium]|nr:tRNA epoxyqueuosine(34) reductase QueG [Bradyrhizobiaceae bacterium]
MRAALEQTARAHGFDVVGVTTPDAAPEAKARLARFIEEGAHGEMTWMAESAARRCDPRALWSEVRSI